MNHLINEKSPYLLQHADNPVDWYPWCTEAFEKAAAEDKPVFLSIGYSTCHWCHVMAHESFEDEEVAEVLNRDYISIKVDREERPDIDSVYMDVCQMMNGSGGWPLTIIMTPDQKPFFAATYIPKRQRYGYTGLLEVLGKVTDIWKYNRKDVLETGTRIVDFLKKEEETVLGEPEKKILHEAVQVFVRQHDAQWGGFGAAPKFPVPHNLLYLMRYSLLEKQPYAMKMVETTLKAMDRGGIHDQIGGGFSRYSTDGKWLVPHFEKMLYDNALLSMAYLEAYQMTGEIRYADVARSTLDYVLRELTGPEGEFFCGQDADSEGKEGKYYVFTPEEIRCVLGQKDGEEFCRIYDITEKGNFEGKSIPNRICESDAYHPWEEDDERLRKLYEYRKDRVQLHRDDKVILSWNSWMMMAIAKAARILGDRKYFLAAVGNARFIRENMVSGTGSESRLFHRWRDNDAAHEGQLDDYAVYGLAMISLYQLTQEPFYLKEAVLRTRQMMEYFGDRKTPGYFLTASYAEQLISRPKETYDGALPSGNSAAAVLLAQAAKITGDMEFQDAADRQMQFLSGSISRYPMGYGMSLIALTEVLYPVKMLICASAASKMPEELQEFLKKKPVYNLFVVLKTGNNQQELAEVLPFTAEYPLPENGAMYYLCMNGMCLKPESDFGKLKI